MDQAPPASIPANMEKLSPKNYRCVECMLRKEKCQGGKPCDLCRKNKCNCVGEEDISCFVDGIGFTEDHILTTIPAPSVKKLGQCLNCRQKRTKCFGGRPCVICVFSGDTCPSGRASGKTRRSSRNLKPLFTSTPLPDRSSGGKSHAFDDGHPIYGHHVHRESPTTSSVLVNTNAAQYRVHEDQYDDISTFLNQANAFNAELHACTASQGPVPFHQPEDRSAGPSTFYQRDDQAIPSVAYVSPSEFREFHGFATGQGDA